MISDIALIGVSNSKSCYNGSAENNTDSVPAPHDFDDAIHVSEADVARPG